MLLRISPSGQQNEIWKATELTLGVCRKTGKNKQKNYEMLKVYV